jgi:ADP-ribosylglycohydrolase
VSVTGSLYGLAYGDALGKPTEFRNIAEIIQMYGPGGPRDLPDPALVTDDTQMALAVADGLLVALGRGPLTPGAFEPPVRGRFLQWWQSWVAEEALATALLCVLLYPDDPVAALSRAATTSGDSDSIAALAGAITGAAHGISA